MKRKDAPIINLPKDGLPVMGAKPMTYEEFRIFLMIERNKWGALFPQMKSTTAQINKAISREVSKNERDQDLTG